MLKHLFDSRTDIANQSACAAAHMNAPLPVRQGFMTIGPALADRLLKEATFEGQRITDPIFVARHIENLKRGLWLDGSQIAFAKVGDKYYLINGKHRLTAIVGYGKPAEFSIVVYECDDIDEVRSLYARFDNVQRARSTGQILAACDLSGQMNVSPRIAKAVYSAVPLLLNGLKPVYTNDPATERLRVDLGLIDFRLSAAMAWADQAKVYERCLVKADPKIRSKLLIANVVAPALYTLKHARERAVPFWEGVACQDGLRRHDPRQTLFNLLLSTPMKNKEEGNGVTAVSLAWNAWAEGRKLASIRLGGTVSQTFIGTPYEGRRR